MVTDAEAHADEDRKQRELAEARNIAENAAYQAEKQLEELGDKVDARRKEEIEAAIKEVRESLDSEHRRGDQGEDRGADRGDSRRSPSRSTQRRRRAGRLRPTAPSLGRRPPMRRRSSTPRWSTTTSK